MATDKNDFGLKKRVINRKAMYGFLLDELRSRMDKAGDISVDEIRVTVTLGKGKSVKCLILFCD